VAVRAASVPHADITADGWQEMQTARCANLSVSAGLVSWHQKIIFDGRWQVLERGGAFWLTSSGNVVRYLTVLRAWRMLTWRRLRAIVFCWSSFHEINLPDSAS
jgi:hypothetical protein